MKESVCPLSKEVCGNKIKNLQSNPKGLMLFKKYLKLILRKGVVCPDLFINKKIDFAFFPRPSLEFLNYYYTVIDVEEGSEKFTYSSSMQNTAKYILNKAIQLGYFSDSQDSQPILDFGCGTGWFSMTICEKYKNIYAMDYTQKLIEYIKNESNGKINGMLNSELNKYKNFFELIFSFDVFEHLSDPIDQAILLYDSLKDNGTCIISVPNFSSYFFRIDISNHLYFGYPAHLNYFTPKSIEYMMRQAGFKDIKVFDTTFEWEKIYIMPEFYKQGLITKKGWPLDDIWNLSGNGERLICFCRK